MGNNSSRHTPRAVEGDIVAQVEAVFADPLKRPSIALLTGPAGYGAAEVLAHGVTARLEATADPERHPTRISGSWAEPASAVQYCLTERDVPQHAPDTDSGLRVLLVACSDIDALPEWVTQVPGPRVRTLPLGPFSLFEAHDFIEATLDGTCTVATAHTLARAAGYAVEPLRIILDEARHTSVLALVSGEWTLMGDPVSDAIVPYLRAQLATVNPAYADAMCTLALAEPFTLEQLPDELATIAKELLRAGEIEWCTDGRIAFLAPGASEALRIVAPEHTRERAARLRASSAAADTSTHAASAGADADAVHEPPDAAPSRNPLREARTAIAAGRPLQTFPELLRLAAPGAADPGAPRAFFRDLGTVLAWATLTAHGPAGLPRFARQLGTFDSDPTDLDLTQRYGLRAFWEAAEGNIGSAHRFATLALEHARHEDPEQLAPLIRALLAEMAALRGEHARAVRLVEESRHTETQHPLEAAVIHRHVAAAEHLLALPNAGGSLLQQAQRMRGLGHFGSAAEVAYVGVRFGRRRPAQLLVDLGPNLTGPLHEIRLSQARALLDKDPLALLQAADALRDAGCALWAAETDAQVLTMPEVPAALQQRATRTLTTYLGTQSLPGHSGLRTPRVSSGEAALTPREQEISDLIHAGLSNADIAERLHISIGTVEGHITRMYRKTGGSRRSPQRRTRDL